MEGYRYAKHPQKQQLMMPLVPKNSANEVFKQDGLIPRSIRELFVALEKHKRGSGNANKVTVSCQYI